jgi:Fe-S cluster assembly protein SufD
MTATAKAPFLDALLGGLGSAGGAGGWLARLRGQALERANALAVPTTRDEEWRFTDLAPLTRLRFQPAAEMVVPDVARVQPHFLPEAALRLVFVDGGFVPQASQLADAGGVSVFELRAGREGRHARRLERHLGRVCAFDADLFVALNTAFLQQGAAIVLDADAAEPSAVHVLHITTRRDVPHVTYPRTLVLAGAGSRSTLIEEFVAWDDHSYFSDPVTEIVLERDASLAHVRVQNEAASAFQLGTCAVSQAAGSRYAVHNIALGARLSRFDCAVTHAGPGCETQVDGLTVIVDRQLADTHSLVDHAHPEGRLRQVHKAVVAGAAHAVFNGKILVRQGAQRTDASQSYRGLLLSKRAHIDAKPQLEIFADDVKCAHGAAIGQLDQDQLFYLRSRGLTERQARNLLTYAFAAEVVERIPVPSLVQRLERVLLERTEANA